MYVLMSVSYFTIGSGKTTTKSKPLSKGEANAVSIDDDNVALKAQPAVGIAEPFNDYIVCKNYMAPQVGGVSKGLFEKFESQHDHKLVQLYCDSLGDECIGYAFNAN